MTQIQAALFTLSGGGDRDVFLAPKSALDWCMDVKPGSTRLPANVKADLAPFLRKEEDLDNALDEEVYITPGSADNDAALFLSCVCKHYSTAVKAVNQAKKENWSLDEDNEYEGCIY
jgi:hypothetical protein